MRRPVTMLPLTERQAEILRFIAYSTLAEGAPPSFKEIMTKFDIVSSNGIRDHVIAIQRKGYLRPSVRQRSRAIVLTDEGRRFVFGEPCERCGAFGMTRRAP